jgi:hypothetical protein
MKEIALPLHPAPARVWIAVVALGICAFSIVTSELAPVGMLSALAADFHQTESGMGSPSPPMAGWAPWRLCFPAQCRRVFPARRCWSG